MPLVRHWAARGLSFLGRVHVAKQLLAASLWYHASFQRPSKQLLKQLSRQLRRFVASAQQASHSDDALALAQGNSQGSAQLPTFFFSFFFLLGYRGIVYPPSADEGTERTWFEPEQRPRKRVPKRSVHGKQSP